MNTKRVGRRKQRLSNTLKQISTVGAILHLFGNSLDHLIDALLSADRTKKLQVEEFSEKLEPHEKKRFERLWKKIKGYEEQLRPLLEEGLQCVGYGKLVPESLRELVPVDLQNGGDPIMKEEDLGETFLDFWAERLLSEHFTMMLTPTQRNDVEYWGRQSVARYMKWGTEHPSVEDYILKEIQGVEKEIAGDIPAIRQENSRLRKELKDLQEARDALDKAPLIIKRSTYSATVRAAVTKAEFLEEIKEAAFGFFKRFPKVIEDVRESLKKRADATEALTAWEKLWALLGKLMAPLKKKTKGDLDKYNDIE